MYQRTLDCRLETFQKIYVSTVAMFGVLWKPLKSSTLFVVFLAMARECRHDKVRLQMQPLQKPIISVLFLLDKTFQLLVYNVLYRGLPVSEKKNNMTVNEKNTLLCILSSLFCILHLIIFNVGNKRQLYQALQKTC